MIVIPDKVNLDEVRIDPAWALRIPSNLALRRLALPLCLVEEALDIAADGTLTLTGAAAQELTIGGDATITVDGDVKIDADNIEISTTAPGNL